MKAGHEVHVATGPGDRGGEYTPDLLPRALESGAVVHRAAAPGIAKPDELRPAFTLPIDDLLSKRPVSRLRQIVSQWKSFPDLQRSWIGPGIELALGLHRRRPYDMALSTSPPESAHYIGHALAAQGVPWVADFRDQWSDYLLARWDPFSRILIDHVTRRVLAPATLVVGASEGVAASLRRAARRDTVCVRNGYDALVQQTGSVRPRSLGYFGRVDPIAQHPERLWEPLRLVWNEGAEWCVDFFTAPGGGGGAVIAPPADLRGAVRVKSPLPHAEALAAMQEMAALLVLGWEVRGGEQTVAGKLYEYVGSGRPVLVCAPEGFEARQLVETTRTGLGAWGDIPIAAALRRLESFVPDAAGRESLSREHSANELLDYFRKAISASDTP